MYYILFISPCTAGLMHSTVVIGVALNTYPRPGASVGSGNRGRGVLFANARADAREGGDGGAAAK